MRLGKHQADKSYPIYKAADDRHLLPLSSFSFFNPLKTSRALLLVGWFCKDLLQRGVRAVNARARHSPLLEWEIILRTCSSDVREERTHTNEHSIGSEKKTRTKSDRSRFDSKYICFRRQTIVTQDAREKWRECGYLWLDSWLPLNLCIAIIN